jgi:cell division septum initiation protein DivIVA
MEKTKNKLSEENEVLLEHIEEVKSDLKQALQERDERTQKILDNQKAYDEFKMAQKHELDALKKEIELRDKQIEALSSKFNDLAKLFDEYIKSFDDIMEVQKLFLRNNLRSQELLQVKIKAFNGEGEKDK